MTDLRCPPRVACGHHPLTPVSSLAMSAPPPPRGWVRSGSWRPWSTPWSGPDRQNPCPSPCCYSAAVSSSSACCPRQCHHHSYLIRDNNHNKLGYYNGPLLLTQRTEPLLLFWHFGQAQALQMIASVTLIAQNLNKEKGILKS